MTRSCWPSPILQAKGTLDTHQTPACPRRCSVACLAGRGWRSRRWATTTIVGCSALTPAGRTTLVPSIAISAIAQKTHHAFSHVPMGIPSDDGRAVTVSCEPFNRSVRAKETKVTASARRQR
jgi:hypothetical protein